MTKMLGWQSMCNFFNKKNLHFSKLAQKDSILLNNASIRKEKKGGSLSERKLKRNF